MNFLSLDIGTTRTGYATGNDVTNVAMPGGVIKVTASDPVQKIIALVGTEHIDAIVVGWPMTLRGEIGPQAKRVRVFVAKLQKKIAVPIFFEDERLSTKAAARLGFLCTHLDAAAAAQILQSFLDRRKSKK